MTGPNANNSEEEQPLDPAAERVRRKLVRFMGINLAILFIAVMAVVAALVYKSMSSDDNRGASQSAMPAGEIRSSRITLPTGTQILSHAVSGNRLTLHLRNANGDESIEIHDLGEGRSLGSVEILREGQ